MKEIEAPIINQESFLAHLKVKLNEGMIEAAEPVLKKALEDIEKEMRKKLASMVVAFLDGYIEMERMGLNLRILVKHEHKQV